MDKDITEHVQFGNNDDEHLPVTMCVCGERFQLWEFIIGIYREGLTQCSNCGRGLYFRNEIRVYEKLGD